MYDTHQLAQLLDIPATTLTAWRRIGVGPRPLKIGSEWCYCADDLAAWVAAGGPLEVGIELFPVRGDADQRLPAVFGDPVGERGLPARV